MYPLPVFLSKVITYFQFFNPFFLRGLSLSASCGWLAAGWWLRACVAGSHHSLSSSQFLLLARRLLKVCFSVLGAAFLCSNHICLRSFCTTSLYFLQYIKRCTISNQQKYIKIHRTLTNNTTINNITTTATISTEQKQANILLYEPCHHLYFIDTMGFHCFWYF